MLRNRTRRQTGNIKKSGRKDDKKANLAEELAYSESEDTGKLTELTSQSLQIHGKMSDLEAVLQEIREFRRETTDGLKGIREELRVANGRIDEAEKRIGESEERVQSVEEATCELIKLQRHLEEKLIDQEGRARRDNIRLHGVKEGAESGAASMCAFVEKLLREKLELPAAFELRVERAHRALGPRPPDSAPPRSIVAKFLSYKCKEEVIKKAWEKKGFVFEEKRVYVDHDYAPAVIKMRKEYNEVKKVLRENKIKFQTPFPARLRVHYEGETCLYESAAEATRDMVKRGLQVRVIRPPEDSLEKIQRRMWHSAQDTGRQERRQSSSLGYKERLQVYRRPVEGGQDA